MIYNVHKDEDKMFAEWAINWQTCCTYSCLGLTCMATVGVSRAHLLLTTHILAQVNRTSHLVTITRVLLISKMSNEKPHCYFLITLHLNCLLMDSNGSITSTHWVGVTLTPHSAFRRLRSGIPFPSVSTEALFAKLNTMIAKALADLRAFRDRHLIVRYHNII